MHLFSATVFLDCDTSTTDAVSVVWSKAEILRLSLFGQQDIRTPVLLLKVRTSVSQMRWKARHMYVFPNNLSVDHEFHAGAVLYIINPCLAPYSTH